MKRNFFIVILLLVCALSAAMLTRHYYIRHTPIPQIDTIVVHDTFCYEKPIPVYTRVIDSIRVAVTDTLRLSDTLYIQLPREQKVYEDSTYRAVVSGYLPDLDTMTVYRKTTTITETIVREVPIKKRWGLGIQVGYGATLNGNQITTSPYVGVGISYNILRF